MLKRISVTHLRLGMYIQTFCGSWLDHPFWRNQFKLERMQDLQAVQSSSIREVWIDTTKGLDVDPGEAEGVVEVVADIPHEPLPAEPALAFNEEVKRASIIVAKAKDAVATMFHEARMGQALNAQDALPLVEEISSSVLRNPSAFVSLARLKTKDDYTYMHSVAVCGLMVALARQLGLSAAETRQAGLAGLLHDIGKMAMPLDILNKPGALTDDEYQRIRQHPVEGYNILLQGEGVDEVVLDVCRHHHEKVDGTGYPDQLAGDEVSLYARMGAVCDVYDAITSNRPYKAGWCPADSLSRMAEWCNNGQFDKAVFQSFVKSVGIYPVGSLVRLESGRLGVVVEQSDNALLKPKIKVFYSIKSDCRLAPEVLDMARKGVQDKIAGHEDPAQWNFPDFNEIWSGVAQSA